MKLFMLAIRKILSKPMINIILIVQIFISLVAINISVGQYQFLNYFENIFEASGLKNVFYLTTSLFEPEIENIDEQITISREIDDKINTIPHIRSYSYTMNFDIHLDRLRNKGFKETRLITYDNYISNKVVLPLSEGDWYAKHQIKENIYPAVIGGSASKVYSVGDTIQCNVEDISGKGYKIRLLVTGKLKEPAYILNFSTGGSKVSYDYFFNRYENVILSNKLVDPQGNEIKNFKSHCRMIVIDNKADKNSLQQCRDTLSNFGNVSSLDEIKEYSTVVIKSKLERQWSANTFLLFLVFVGMIGSNILFVYRQMDEYSIYYLCGLKWSNCIIIVFYNVLTISLVAFLFAFAFISTPLLSEKLLLNTIINMTNTIICIILVILIVTTSTILPLLKLRKSSPVTLLRRFI